MKTADFDFHLPPERIADHPVRPRDAARLLEVGPSLCDRIVRDLPELLQPGDVMVYNDTRVIPARLYGQRGAVRVEVLLHKREGDDAWAAFARPGKRLKVGQTIDFADGFTAAIEDKRDGGEVRLRFSVGGAALFERLHAHGAMPLPPYIRRPEGEEASDREDYQTVFASREGAVAAPTAGLHFTPELLARLDARGVRRVPVTLHVGAGTFLPVKVEDIREHRMHAEYGEVSPETAAAVNAARAAGGRVLAVGTTALRLLESAAAADGTLAPFADETDIFIFPGYRFRAVDLLLTNFHLPRSTLFMLVCAFAGMERMRAAYDHAIATGYRFYSYGDASLLRRTP
ncbi:tRNA preQ1(34) S-adenosylmethionine ribosyltransferase-isomerase QueA [Azospirillum halopraeferens]|uniref:tRNA preQ1(34) S-adenosylmethionine ribosyltransferase-isomerase QueA n=1 Tax=Azospirillum halopraeferens TaxID=34010 RepID=UPI0004111CA2|nr:tRNA preQ1(34) S-adenosylmethionine ribosyltransferase-isomerase QueA [Azospirillum halopraeferens]